MHQDNLLSNFYEDGMNILSTMYHYVSLAFQRKFYCFFFSTAFKLKGISSLACKSIPLRFDLQSNLYGVPKPSIKTDYEERCRQFLFQMS